MSNTNSQQADVGESENATSLVVAEYTALRLEISRYQDHQNQFRTLAIILLGAVLGLAGSIHDMSNPEATRSATALFLLVPLVYLVLGGLTVDRSSRILDIAAYLDTDLRSIARGLAGGAPVFGWEEHKRGRARAVKLAGANADEQAASGSVERAAADAVKPVTPLQRVYARGWGTTVVATFAYVVPAMLSFVIAGGVASWDFTSGELVLVYLDSLTLPVYGYFIWHLVREERGELGLDSQHPK